jgi:hypothetical protein
MAKQTKAQKIAEAVKSLAIMYSIYSDSLTIGGEDWEMKRRWVLDAQGKVEELIGEKVEVVTIHEWEKELA